MKTLLLSTFLATALLSAPAFAQQAPEVIHNRVITQTKTTTVKPLIVDKKTDEVKPAIQQFVELINEARVDIAMKQPQNAIPKLDEAQQTAKFIKTHSSVEEVQHETRITSGRVMYNDTTTSGAYYVPFESGPVKVKTVQETPSNSSNKNGLVVSSAEVVYLTVDLTGDEADTYITKAKSALKQGDAKAADESLAALMKETVIVDATEMLPYDKARDNLDLALRFLQDENYTAARYALDQSAEALKSMNTDNRYNSKEASNQSDQIKQIHDLVMQENTNAASKARTQIISAKNDLAKVKN